MRVSNSDGGGSEVLLEMVQIKKLEEKVQRERIMQTIIHS